jgi:hypothetical protein
MQPVFKVDERLRVVSAYGVSVSADLFEFFSKDANEGKMFKLIKSADEYGSVTIQAFQGETDEHNRSNA